MGGLAVLFFIGLYLVIAFKVVRKFRASRYKWLVVALVILIPSGDAVVGRLYLKHLCAQEGGLKVHRVVEGVEGFLTPTADERWILQHKFRFVEGNFEARDRTVQRLTIRDGKIVSEFPVPSIASYEMRFSPPADLAELYTRWRYIVTRRTTGELLGAYTDIRFRGGWAERFIAQFSDAGGGSIASCDAPYPEIQYEQLVLNTLKPTKFLKGE